MVKMTADIPTLNVDAPCLPLACQLGEGPFYETTNNKLRIVDIIKKQIHVISLMEDPEVIQTIHLDQAAGVTANIEGYDAQGKCLVSLEYGIAV